MTNSSPNRTGRLASGAVLLMLAACAPAMPAEHMHARMQVETKAAADPPVAPPTAGQPYAVKIANFTFDAPTIEVPVGATVTWTNVDDVPHTVVSSDRKTFKSKVLDTDQSFSFTFTAAGEYEYFCSIHPHMTGKVVVKAN